METSSINKIYSALRRSFRPKVWCIQGQERSSGHEFRLLFAGGDTDLNYIASLAMQPDFVCTSLGNLWLWSVYWKALRERPAFDMAVITIRPSLARVINPSNSFLVPVWVEGKIDIPMIPNTNSSKHDVRLIKKHRFSFMTTSCEEELRDFYHNAYLPYASKRFGSQAILRDLEEQVQLLRQKERIVLLVFRDNNPVAGALIATHEHSPKPVMIGVHNADEDQLRNGAVSAVYYFAAQYLAGLDYSQMSLGLSRSFLDDGVLRYKAKWGMSLTRAVHMAFMVWPRSISAGTRGFLASHPFVISHSGLFEGAIFFDGFQEEREDLNKLNRRYWVSGLRLMRVFRCDPTLTEITTFSSK